MTNNKYKKWDKIAEKYNLMLDNENYEDLETAFAKIFEEGRLRREKEILIMMDECEKEGWDFNRFINTFSELINKNEKDIA